MNIGDMIKDNDPRVGNRILRIIYIGETHVHARQGNLKSVQIRKDRIYNDGIPRRTGFTLLQSNVEHKSPPEIRAWILIELRAEKDRAAIHEDLDRMISDVLGEES